VPADVRGYGGSRVARSWSGTREIWDCNQDHSSGINLREDGAKLQYLGVASYPKIKQCRIDLIKIDTTDTS